MIALIGLVQVHADTLKKINQALASASGALWTVSEVRKEMDSKVVCISATADKIPERNKP